jgi:hypothetical protein
MRFTIGRPKWAASCRLAAKGSTQVKCYTRLDSVYEQFNRLTEVHG